MSPQKANKPAPTKTAGEHPGAAVKEGWQATTLGAEIDLLAGFAFKSAQYTNLDADVRLLRGDNIVQGCLRWDDVRKWPVTDIEAYNRYQLRDGDIVLAMDRPWVKAGLKYAAISSEDLPCLLVQRTARLRGGPNLDNRFLMYLLSSEGFTNHILGVQTGIGVPHISGQQIKDFLFARPPLPEQKRIVALLDEAFAGIATAKANAEKNLQNARALFESHLQSVFTQSDPGWKQKTLEEIATTFGRGKSKHRPRNDPKLYGGQYPFIQTGDIRNAVHIITKHSQTYNESGLAQSKLWPKGTICITIAANIAETAILGFDACFPDSVIGVVANPREADVGFVEYLLQSFKARIQAMGKGSAQANINMGTFENERFPFPSVAEQKQIVITLDNLRAETQRLASIYEKKIAALDALKKALLQQAFSGEL